jgi:hypothetical protein
MRLPLAARNGDFFWARATPLLEVFDDPLGMFESDPQSSLGSQGTRLKFWGGSDDSTLLEIRVEHTQED